LRRGRSPRRLHGDLVHVPVAGAADPPCLPCALVLDAREIARGRSVLDQPSLRPPSGARPSLQRSQRRAWVPPLRRRAMDCARDRRSCPRRCGRGLRLPGRRDHRTPLPCDRARRGGEPQARRRRTGSGAPARRLRAPGLRRRTTPPGRRGLAPGSAAGGRHFTRDDLIAHAADLAEKGRLRFRGPAGRIEGRDSIAARVGPATDACLKNLLGLACSWEMNSPPDKLAALSQFNRLPRPAIARSRGDRLACASECSCRQWPA
jgi:hypothetical protein